MSAPIRVTHFSDPGCPWAYSASPHLAALRWRYGDQLEWRHVWIGLTEDAGQYRERGYTPTRQAQGQVAFRALGMPFGTQPKDDVSATAPACRALVAVRLADPSREWEAFRALQHVQFTTPGRLEDPSTLRAGLSRVPGLDVDALVDALFSDAVTEAYEADRAEARTAEGGATHVQGKSANSDGLERYTAPSLIFERVADGRTLEVGGFQPFEAYDVALANLEPQLSRRPAPEDVVEVVERFPFPLSTREIAAITSSSLFGIDDDDAYARLIEAAASGRVHAEDAGSGVVWHAGPVDGGTPDEAAMTPETAAASV